MSVSDLYIDVGAGSAAEVAALGIRVGDPVTFIGELAEFTGSDRVCGKAMTTGSGRDPAPGADRASWRHAARDGAGRGQVLEEVGLRGAIMATYRNEPDYAIAIDGLSAGDTPDSSPTKDISVVMGRGPVVFLAASTGAFRGSIAHPAMKRHLLAAAAAADIPVQLATHLGRGSTEAANDPPRAGRHPDHQRRVLAATRTRSNEMVDLNDAAAAVRVVAQGRRPADRGATACEVLLDGLLGSAHVLSGAGSPTPTSRDRRRACPRRAGPRGRSETSPRPAA